MKSRVKKARTVDSLKILNRVASSTKQKTLAEKTKPKQTKFMHAFPNQFGSLILCCQPPLTVNTAQRSKSRCAMVYRGHSPPNNSTDSRFTWLIRFLFVFKTRKMCLIAFNDLLLPSIPSIQDQKRLHRQHNVVEP